MAVEIFTKQQFEQALPTHRDTGSPLWTNVGLKKGEHTYRIPVNSTCSIEIRSVHANGFSAPTGADSIRAWLVDAEGNPVGSKVQSYVTRTAGWHFRLVDMLRKLYKMGSRVVMCPQCSKLVQVFKVKKEGPTKGALFTKCDCSGSFKWLEV